MKKTTQIFSLLVFLLFSGYAFADSHSGYGHSNMNNESKRNKGSDESYKKGDQEYGKKQNKGRYSKGKEMERGNPLRRMQSRLDLSYEQEEQIESLYQQHSNTMQEWVRNSRGNQQNLQKLMLGNLSDDEAQVLIDQRTSHQKAMMMMNFQLAKKVWNLLTDEQKSQAKEMLSKRDRRGRSNY